MFKKTISVMKPESCMATRSTGPPTGPTGRKPGETCTEFQLHKSQKSFDGNKRNIFDYSEYRLKLYIEQTVDDQQKMTLKEVLANYKKGMVAVAWKSGRPVWINVTKENKRP